MQTTRSSIKWNAWGETDPGKKRDNNEDRILCEAERGIFVVVDGMGGEAAGEVAAQQAIDFIKARLHQETGTAARRLREAIAGANNEIFRLAGQNPQWSGMACVLTAAVVEEGMLHVGHVGDSRLYRIRNARIEKITSDHSPVGQKEDSGELTEAEAMKHPRRNEVFRDVGSQLHKPDDDDFIQYLQLPFDRDAAWILCSDGLSDMLSSKEILKTVLENAGNPQESVSQLIRMANTAGGKDNISAIVIEGDGFTATSARGNRAPSAGPRILSGRPAFLVYGLILGLLAGLWYRSSGTAVAPSGPSVQAPAVLKVEPGSLEYPTIAQALEAARAGDRIEIADGRYEEVIHLKDGVEIAARTPGKAVLRVARALPDAEAVISAHGVRNAAIKGIVIEAEPAAGLAFGIKLHDSEVDVSNVEVSGAIKAGILVDGNSSGVVSANFFHANAGSGILISGAANPYVVGNLVYANGKSNNRKHPGMHITGSSNPEVIRNIFSGNGSEAIRLQRQELKEKMNNNLFLNSAVRIPVVVEQAGQ